jgi:hypothetical protein
VTFVTVTLTSGKTNPQTGAPYQWTLVLSPLEALRAVRYWAARGVHAVTTTLPERKP